VPGLETISSAATTSGSDARLENNTLGLFVQQQFGYRDRIFLTGALRADDNSAFGDDYDLAYYPKLSASWVLHEEPWWRVRHVDALRLRMAYGASGQQRSRAVTGPRRLRRSSSATTAWGRSAAKNSRSGSRPPC
jgi:hypothetical protein